MLGNKTLVLVVAVLAVGLFVMPSALALFAGQHTFYTGSGVDCAKCHGAEAGELAASGMNAAGSQQIHYSQTCLECHQSADAGYNQIEQHAAIAVPCVACHPNVARELQDSSEGHTEFYYGALDDNSTILKDANEACIACHTQIATTITWERATTLEFTAGHTAEGWTVDDFAVGAGALNTTTTTGGGY